jgi:hypothetical protein
VFKDGPGHRGNLIQAFTTGINGTALNPVMLALLFALGAVRNPVRKTLFPKMLKAGIVGRKLTVEIINCVP